MIFGNRLVCNDAASNNPKNCSVNLTKITDMDTYNNAMFALYSFTFGQEVDKTVN